jgi:hypothetical protein
LIVELFGNSFRNVRNNHVIPRISFGVSRKKMGFWSLKDVFTNKILSLTKLTGKSIEIELEKEDYYKAIQCDVEMFMNKTLIQSLDYINQKNTSSTWSFVTLYYLLFFSTTCLFRLLDKGFIFLSKEHTNRLENYSLARYSSIISLDAGNYYFNIKEINSYGNVVINLTSKGDSVHKSTWYQLESTFRDFKKVSKEDETVLYELLLDHFSKFKTEYPSHLRNKLNYNGESCVHDLENLLPIQKLQEINKNFLKNLVSFDSDNLSYENQMKSVSFLASFIFELNNNLYNEYICRSKFGKDFQTERENYSNLRMTRKGPSI